MNRAGARPERGNFWGRNCMSRALVFNRKADSGLAETRSELSVNIRTGGVSREEALKDLHLINMDGIRPDETIKGFCDTFDISEQEFDQYLGRMYSDSKNILRFYIKPRLNKVTKWVFGPKNDIKGPCYNAECHPGLYCGLAAAKALLCTCLTQIKGAEPELLMKGGLP